MDNYKTLHQLLYKSAQIFPDHIAIEDTFEKTISYKDLEKLSDMVRDILISSGVRRGDRVGIYLPKSNETVVSIFGVLKSGAAYVPVDINAPLKRTSSILNDCSVKAIITSKNLVESLQKEFKGCEISTLEEIGSDFLIIKILDDNNIFSSKDILSSYPDNLAYILYTSGSTGKPKGVTISHRNALSFINWCTDTFKPNEKDRFSSHAPFHFDLSILDLYLAIKHGATVILIGEELGKQPTGLASIISNRRITIWYSTPSILSLMSTYGKMERYDNSSLRLLLFAGEVFPVKHLRKLKSVLPNPRYFNLYGPTETNVCTYYEIPSEIPEDRTEPFPIGMPCSHVKTKVINEHGNIVKTGQIGELCISGPSLMLGYWNLPDLTVQVLFKDNEDNIWYKTGDIVTEGSDGNYIFIGRRDRMVKRRGYRIELGEIEAALYDHPAFTEVAAIALPDQNDGLKIKAFLCCSEDKAPSLIELKKFCTKNLPMHMIPDYFSFQPSLPKTSTDKIDYRKLKELC